MQWTDDELREYANKRIQRRFDGSPVVTSEAMAYLNTAIAIRDDLVAQLAAKDTKIDALKVEYKALWDAAIAFINSPGNLESMAVDSYSALVRQVMRSRFWNEAVETTAALP